MAPITISAPWRAALRSWLIGSRVSRLRDGRCLNSVEQAPSLRTDGEQQAHLDAFIVLFRDIDDLITSLVEQIAATGWF